MTTISVPEAQAKQGIRLTTQQVTTIQIQTASIEILVGGPYGDHPYGHTALRVVTKTDERIYDYGRYGQTWGIGKSEGEGVLNIWSSFGPYIAGENSLGRQTTGFLFDVPEEQAQRVMKFYDAKVAGKKPTSASKQKKSFVIEDYHALGPNCTTLSVAGAKVALPDIDKPRASFQKGRGLSLMEKGLVSAKGWPDQLFMPADLQAMLDSATGRKPKSIKTYGAKK
jgi:hypothetical protein